MQLTGGIKMTQRHWRVLDLLAILLVAGTVLGIVAVWSGAWWPFESLQLPEWPMLAFFAWFLATSTALVIFGAHLQWTDVTRAAARHQQAVSEARRDTAGAVPEFAGAESPCLHQHDAEPVELLESSESDVEGPVLVGAGR